MEKAAIMFRVKICGVTRVEDVQGIVAAGADAIGLNFYPPSPRYLSPQVADAVVAAIPRAVAKVGVFVNADEATIRATAERHRLDYLQLHGDESPEFLSRLSDLPVIRAVRLDAEKFESVARYLHQCSQMGVFPLATLVDAFSREAYGGTGRRVDTEIFHRLQGVFPHASFILAGGLTPDNVGDAILKAKPWGVDTAGGVESSPAIKDRSLCERFVAEARRGLTAASAK